MNLNFQTRTSIYKKGDQFFIKKIYLENIELIFIVTFLFLIIHFNLFSISKP